jgi:RND family efflux transporter MFP subunit
MLAKMKQVIHWFVVGIVLTAGCGKSNPTAATGRNASSPRTVAVAKVETRPMEHAIIATGTLVAQEESTLSAKVAGRLEKVAVDVGSVVRQGDLLAQVEPRDYELLVQQAKAALAQARTAVGLPLLGDDDTVKLEDLSTVKQAKAVLDESLKNRTRIQDLAKSGIAAQSELDKIEASYAVALTSYQTAREQASSRMAVLTQRRAEYDIACKQLADTSVRAPFDAVVQSRSANVGEYVAIGTHIVKLVKTDPLRLRLSVPERESALVRLDQAVRLFIEGDSRVYKGRIARLSPALDEQSRMLLVEADVPAQGVLRGGMFARAQIIVDERESGLSIPASAVITFAGLEKVVAYQDDKALEKTVTTGRRGAGWVEIVNGLRVGELVVVEPHGLRTGDRLAIAGP